MTYHIEVLSHKLVNKFFLLDNNQLNSIKYSVSKYDCEIIINSKDKKVSIPIQVIFQDNSFFKIELGYLMEKPRNIIWEDNWQVYNILMLNNIDENRLIKSIKNAINFGPK